MTHTETSAALVIDPVRTIVTVDGHPVDVKRKQFKLLTVLASDPTRCFTREQLACGIWGDSFKRGNALRSQISLLRAALGRDRFVVNVHDVGYRLVKPDQADLVGFVGSTT